MAKKLVVLSGTEKEAEIPASYGNQFLEEESTTELYGVHGVSICVFINASRCVSGGKILPA